MDRDTRVRDRGLDSIGTARLLIALEERSGRRLDIATLWAQPTIGAIVAYVLAPTAPAVAPESEPTATALDIAQWPELRRLRERRAALAEAAITDPFFVAHDGLTTRETVIDGRPVLNFSSYNYLGLASDPAVMRAAQAAISRWGTSASASRLVAGERPVHAQLESAFARFLGVDDAVAFLGGHAANVATIPLLVGPGDVVLCDANLHNSAMLGAQYSGAARLVFPHNDVDALDAMLARNRARYRRALILIEGLYSADGDTPDLAAFVEVKRRHTALLMVDEAHSLGVLGATGRGIAEHCGVPRADVDVWMATLSKSFASAGGIIAGRADLMELIRFTAPGFVFSVGMPPADAAAALAALERLVAEPSLATRVQANGARLHALAVAAGLDVGASMATPIVPVIVGTSGDALRLSAYARAHGVSAAPMIEPAVPEGAARLRLFVSALHEDADLQRAVDIIARGLATVRDAAPGHIALHSPRT